MRPFLTRGQKIRFLGRLWSSTAPLKERLSQNSPSTCDPSWRANPTFSKHRANAPSHRLALLQLVPGTEAAHNPRCLACAPAFYKARTTPSNQQPEG